MASEKVLVHLRDAETGNTYAISVTPEEQRRLESDIGFATAKLYEAIKICNDSMDSTNLDDLQEVDENGIPHETGGFKWPHEAIILLIEEYRIRQNDFSNGKMSQKKIWTQISEVMVKHGYKVTGPQCQSKFAGLKRTYKGVKDHNTKSGNGTRLWPYFSQMNDLLGDKPFMSPMATASSTGKKSFPDTECSTSNDSLIDEKPQNKKRNTSSVDGLIADLKEKREIAEAATERRHGENMQMRERLLKVFENLVDIMQKK